jgi:hypothetical protein
MDPHYIFLNEIFLFEIAFRIFPLAFLAHLSDESSGADQPREKRGMEWQFRDSLI